MATTTSYVQAVGDSSSRVHRLVLEYVENCWRKGHSGSTLSQLGAVRLCI